MKKRNDILADSIIFALIFFISCVVVMFAEMLVITVLDKVVIMTPVATAIVRTVIYCVGCFSIISIASYKIGYHSPDYSSLGLILSGVIASVMHFLISLLFSFEAFCAGAVKFVSVLVKFGSKINSSRFDGELFRYDCIPVFCIFAAIYITLTVVFAKIGGVRRLSDQKKLYDANATESSTDSEE